jgi:hypothetical protein
VVPSVERPPKPILRDVAASGIDCLGYMQTKQAGRDGEVDPRELAAHRCRMVRLDEVWSGREDLNLRPHRPERCALPSCATPRPNAR